MDTIEQKFQKAFNVMFKIIPIIKRLDELSDFLRSSENYKTKSCITTNKPNVYCISSNTSISIGFNRGVYGIADYNWELIDLSYSQFIDDQNKIDTDYLCYSDIFSDYSYIHDNKISHPYEFSEEKYFMESLKTPMLDQEVYKNGMELMKVLNNINFQCSSFTIRHVQLMANTDVGYNLIEFNKLLILMEKLVTEIEIEKSLVKENYA